MPFYSLAVMMIDGPDLEKIFDLPECLLHLSEALVPQGQGMGGEGGTFGLDDEQAI